jgi:hypothetical protein
MVPKFAKVSEIAERFRVSVDAVYLWIRQGKIPADCVVRIAGTVRVDEEQFERRLRSGALCQQRGRKRTTAIAPGSGELRALVLGEDNFKTVEGPWKRTGANGPGSGEPRVLVLGEDNFKTVEGPSALPEYNDLPHHRYFQMIAGDCNHSPFMSHSIETCEPNVRFAVLLLHSQRISSFRTVKGVK